MIDNLQQREIRTAREQLDRVFAFVRRAMRHFWLGTLIVCLGGAASVGVALVVKRKYMSETVILYRELIDATYVQGASARRMSARDVGMRLRELVLGRPRLRQLINEFKLFPEIVENRSHIEAQDKLRKRVKFRLGGGDTIHISFIGPSAKVAQKVTARLAELVLAEDVRIRSEQAQRTVRFLEGERKRAEDELKKRERSLAQFLASHPEFAADENRTAGAAVRAKTRKKAKPGAPVSPLAIMGRQMRRIRDQLAQAQGRKPVVVRDPKLQAAKTRAERDLAEAKTRLSRLSSQFTKRHPDVQSAQARVNLAKAQLARIMERAKAATKLVDVGGKAEAALKQRLGELRGQIAGYKRRRTVSATNGGSKQDRTANQIVALETDWTRLNREVQEARERYIRIETRTFQASLAETSKVQGSVGNMRIIDPAYLPKRPSGAGRTKLVLVGGAASVFFAMALVFGLALIDERIYSHKDAERLRIAEVLAVVPVAKRGVVGQIWQRRYLRKLRKGKKRRS